MLLTTIDGLSYNTFDVQDQDEFKQISRLISGHLSEPYSIYVYWFFLNTWPQYCYTVKVDGLIIGVIISKVEPHRNVRVRGYIGMLVIDPQYRNRGIASHLVHLTIKNMVQWENVDEIMLETEVINKGALRLYESLGFLRTKRLYRYYLNTHDAYRLILPLTAKATTRIAFLEQLEKLPLV
ncbi:acyl-CoA N-acyltransferase [Suhomyces tanzawaensis NRRL Y-17324]|uniref:N-alpha-acetyltransferase 30 n=1 Tax=Suhomyces tanzawaensis NRRL Y-17324 TaxID=984487 RepID=A0A1E4SQL3_9ASCO|nr:acyl-CoA N-acyltransferase [Suhomyces tanzawaensis NRRL Y-17324]ODV81702.1 acyl-CoA N-acyltransferase [Suhomyces tanzawaensis NRRL Y-17324]